MTFFFISCFSGTNSGAGGHYYSLLTMAQALSHPYRIIVVGDFFPPALRDQPQVEFVQLVSQSMGSFSPASLDHIGTPERVHAYDVRAALYASKTAAYFGVPLVVTKPGGAPLKPWSQVYRHMVVFHGEDYQRLARRRWLQPARFALIGNRVRAPEASTVDRPDPFAGFGEGALRLMRIARIGSAYIDSIHQTVALLDRLQADGLAACLAIVGRVEDPALHRQLTAALAGRTDVVLLTDDAYTVRAAELIPYADVVVGTGRGVMEAMVWEKYVFFPLAGATLPCFLTPETYKVASYRNFSPRLSVSDGLDAEAGYHAFCAIYAGEGADSYRKWLARTFTEAHDVRTGANRLLDFYCEATQVESRRDYCLRLAVFRLLQLKSWLAARLRTLLAR